MPRRALALDPTTWDIPAGRSLTILEAPTDEARLIAQHVKQRLDTGLGEWSFDVDAGLPYHQRILSRRADLQEIAAWIRAEAAKVRGVESVPRCDLAWSWPDRSLSGEVEVRYELGTVAVLL